MFFLEIISLSPRSVHRESWLMSNNKEYTISQTEYLTVRRG